MTTASAAAPLIAVFEKPTQKAATPRRVHAAHECSISPSSIVLLGRSRTARPGLNMKYGPAGARHDCNAGCDAGHGAPPSVSLGRWTSAGAGSGLQRVP